MRTVTTLDGHEIPRLGLGTWRMGEDSKLRKAEVAALKLGVELGMSLIDTAEMYANGGAEEVVREAIVGIRDQVYLVSKVLPHNASREGTVDAVDASLRRLGVEAIDLYLLHWRGPHPLAETLEAFTSLKEQGKIRSYGVSNFDNDDIAEIARCSGGTSVAVNQVLYNLSRRGIERGLFQDSTKRGIRVMAYSPLEQARLRQSKALNQVAARHEVAWSEIALAWVLQQKDLIAIPKASDLEHVRRNFGAESLCLSDDDVAVLNAEFPRPTRDIPLETL